MSIQETTSTENKPVAPRKKLHVIAKIGLVGVIVILGFVGYVASLPDNFQVQRSGMINAPADIVFPLINNFHEWGQWSPWENIDPDLKRTYEGPDAGPGAIYSWVGNSEVGAGQMTILESKPADLISIKLEFFKPFAGLCPTTFKLEPSESGTKVTWTMNGKYNFISKTMSVFISMDKMIGKNFEDGLAKMNTVAQAKSKDIAVPSQLKTE
ncbi:MAG: hypothetical protein JWM11_396 [Planctomycetaceae bacterium]|nr:hypothetical protein [Planctomycetaceae bacterium]